MKVAIINYGNGNFGSLVAAFERLDIHPQIWSHGRDVNKVNLVVFPGVGALPDVMTSLTRNQLLDPLTAMHQNGTPFFGICLGMQLFFGPGDEGGSGLGWLPGHSPSLKAPILPHIGWNTVRAVPDQAWLYANLPPDPAFYFVHTYRTAPHDLSIVAGLTTYEEQFPSMVASQGLTGVQFHPELSGPAGQQILVNVLERSSSALDTPFEEEP